MNIALYHNLPSGGARRAMVEMVKGLVARGHTVDEWCPETADLAFLPLDGVVRRTMILPLHLRGVATRRVPLLTPYLTAAQLAGDLRAMAALGRSVAKEIDRQDYDVVFAHDCQLVLVPDVIRFLRKPNLHYCHAATSAISRSAEVDQAGTDWRELLKCLYYMPARHMYPALRFRQAEQNLRAARRVLANSLFAAAELHDAFNVDADVCYLGVDTATFRPLELPRERFLLSVGAIHPNKGYRFLMRALAQLPNHHRPPLIIAANSAEPLELEALHTMAAQLDLDLSVRNVTDSGELTALYNRASAFVYCPIREPWGLAAVEAMACGTPVVAVGEGGVAESVIDGETGLLTLRDAGAFAAALERVFTDSVLAAHLGAGGVARTRAHFTWAATVDRLETHFREMQGG